MDLEELFKLLEEELLNICLLNKEDYINKISEWFAFIILNQPKYILDHSFDPSYDHSGRLIEDENGYDLDSYDTFYDFAENNYTGVSIASYVSGCGLYYQTYSDELEEKTNEWVMIQLERFLYQFLEENPPVSKEVMEELGVDSIEAIIDEIYFSDIIYDFSFEIIFKLIEMINPINVKFLFKKREEEAKEEIREQILEEEKRLQERIENSKNAKRLWDKVVKIYQIKVGSREDLTYVDKPFYDKNIAPILREMNINGIKSEEIQMIGKYSPIVFSNSVKRIISNFKD